MERACVHSKLCYAVRLGTVLCISYRSPKRSRARIYVKNVCFLSDRLNKGNKAAAGCGAASVKFSQPPAKRHSRSCSN